MQVQQVWFTSSKGGSGFGASLHSLPVELAGEDLCGKLAPGDCAVVFGTAEPAMPVAPKIAVAVMQVLECACMHADFSPSANCCP